MRSLLAAHFSEIKHCYRITLSTCVVEALLFPNETMAGTRVSHLARRFGFLPGIRGGSPIPQYRYAYDRR